MDATRSTFSLPATPAAVRAGRHQIQDTLCSWGLKLDEDLELAVGLVASELLTNGHRHAGGQLTVVIDVDADRLILEVFDDSVTLPVRREAAPDACEDGGRGLALIEAYSLTFGAELTMTGKRCWAVLTLSSAVLPEGTAAPAADTSLWSLDAAGAALLGQNQPSPPAASPPAAARRGNPESTAAHDGHR
ncbi:ATP-binding protein [Streptomyces sp. NPDC003023]|uniref:ATP-binding protein n=1 Tax=Streptomyces sp. NPDC003023 TaxID=3364675 RepID=UPI003677CA5C